MNILVTDGDSRAALAVTRSLGRRGHRVMVAASESCLAQASRHCALRLVSPRPSTSPSEFVEWLERTVRDSAVDVLMPATDVTTLLVASHRERLERYCRVPLASATALETAADKAQVMALAARVGVPIPKTFELRSPDGALPGDIPYPIVIKPHRSRVRHADGWLSSSVSYADDEADLRRQVARRHVAEFPLLLQERIIGPGTGAFVCYDRGRLVALFGHRRLREKPPWGGVSVLSESVAVSPEIAGHTEALFREIGWHGVAMAEYKVDERDGTPRLMEINGRFWGSLQLAIDAGVDFPAILADVAAGKTVQFDPAFRVGVRSRWLWGDLDSLVIRLSGRHSARLGAPPQRLKAITEFLHLWGRDLYYDNPKPSDLRPWIFETLRRFGLG